MWQAPVLSEPAKEYVIKYRQKYSDSNAFKKRKVDPNLLSTTIDKLEPFQLYEFIIVTVGEFGEGLPSIPKEAQTAPAAPGRPPSKVQARSLSRDSVLIKWSPSEKPNGIITSYRIYYTNKDRSTPITQWEMVILNSFQFVVERNIKFAIQRDTNSDELMATLYGLEAETRYFIMVQAHNIKGASDLSSVVTVATKHGSQYSYQT
ncbi:fibronectin type III domain protein [Dictyocaulus viviparus]|uniref:Fibronectin type III domain protein n=1 Tax=Dictyocaulus viviparus TaxID=29172 RepID=A0A0D8Y505_DICVI|nr:fibronectin type III domain protein [Dictyocaulus viviparus]